MKIKLTIALLGMCCTGIFGQQRQDILNYVAQYKAVAIEEMVRTKVPASITLAQGILESGIGQSPLATRANNHFGIKCKDEWTGKRFFQDDDAPNECFRVYANARESYADHSDFLLTRSRYADLFQLPIGDYKAWANGLKAAGYATNPKYASILIGYIENYQLHQYDEIGYAEIQQNNKLIDAQLTSAPTQPAKTTDVAQSKTNTTAVPKEPTHTEEEFLVNGLRAVRAKGGEAPFAVAFKYQIDYNRLLAYNDLTEGEKFKAGENIFLQAKKTRAAEPTYIVKPGESMRDVAQKFGIKVKELYFKNLMYANEQVKAGETIYLQTKRTALPKVISYAEYLKTLEQPKASANAKTSLPTESAYQVQQKDTLYSIARKFNTTVEKIKAINNMDSAELKAGQTIVISE